MIQQDTLQLISDSTQTLSVDTLAKLDTLPPMPSIMLFDTIKAMAHALVKGHTGIPHPSFPGNEAWVFGALVVFFFLFVLSISHTTGLITEIAKNFFQVKERSSIFSKTTITDFRFRFFLNIFSIGVLSLYAYLILYQPKTDFSILEYGCFLVATLLFFGIKSLLLDMLGYVFLDPQSLKMAKESYFNIISLLGVSLFPLLILQIYTPYNLYYEIETFSLVLCISACILVIIKLFQIFFRKVVASVYILLYLCTLEFLPLVALYLVYNLILQGV